MSTLEEIESAIEQLPASEKWALFHHLQERFEDDWDRQIKADEAAGRLGFLIAEAKSDIALGKTKSLDEVIYDS